MSIKSFFAKIYAKTVVSKNQKWIENPIDAQEKLFQYLINEAKKEVEN